MIDPRLESASDLAEQERWEEALELLLEVAAEGEDATVFCMLGTTVMQLGEDAEANEYFRRCLALEPSDPVVLSTAGYALALVGDPEGEPALRMGALTAPDTAVTRLHYGSFLAREGLLDEALSELSAARSLDAENPLIRTELAVAYLLRGELEPATGELEEALSSDPEDEWARALHGLALVGLERMEEAAEQLLQAATHRPEDVEIQLVAALAGCAAGWEEAGWEAFYRAEAAGGEAGAIGEVEDALASGPEAAERMLRTEAAPSALRARLLTAP
jgi:Flp pilus assembly protein TadD